MKHWSTIAILLVTSRFAAAQQLPHPPAMSPEERPIFVSVGAVSMFKRLCLLTYPDKKKFSAWQQEHAGNKLKLSEFRRSPTDEVYRIPTPAVSFVLVAAKENACSIYAVGTKREAMESELEVTLRAHAESEKGGSLKVTDFSKGDKHSTRYEILSPAGKTSVEVIYSDSTTAEGMQKSAITGVMKKGK